MSGQGFMISGAALSLLKPGEMGTIVRISNTDESVLREFEAIGLMPGAWVTLEQRSPIIIQLGQERVVLGQESARTVYVRLMSCQTAYSQPLPGVGRLAKSLVNRLFAGKNQRPASPRLSVQPQPSHPMI